MFLARYVLDLHRFGIADSAVIYQVVVLAEVGFFSEDDERRSTGQLAKNGDNLEGAMSLLLVASDDNRLISHDQSVHRSAGDKRWPAFPICSTPQ